MINQPLDRSTFNETLKNILGNLYDLAALETNPMLFSIIEPPVSYKGNKGEYVRQLVLDGIEELRPLRNEESIKSPEWRAYYIMYKRYVEGVNVQELSDLLSISPRQMRRDHHRALIALSEILWHRCYPSSNEPSEPVEPQTPSFFEVHNEVIDPVETTRGVYQMLKHRIDEKGIQVSFTSPESQTPVITDRVILRQALIGMFNDFLHIHQGPMLQVVCREMDDQFIIELVAEVSSQWEPAGEEEDDDDLNAVQYWCKWIGARIEEKTQEKDKKKVVTRSLWLPHTNQKVMLIIDDQQAVLSLFKRYLSQTQLLPVGVENPEHALNLARRLQPVLITLDVMMPKMDGWELLQVLKLDPEISHIPIIVCSAWDDPDLSRSLGAAAFLKKPVTQKMLLDVVTKLLPDA